MRIPSLSDYETARAALAVYAEFSKAYLRPNGWTVIPADAPRPSFNGSPLTSDAVNAYSTTAELFELATERPERFSAYACESDRQQRDATNYVAYRHRNLTTWTGESVGSITFTGPWHRNNLGGKWRPIRVRADWGGEYYGREYDSRQLVNLRRAKRA